MLHHATLWLLGSLTFVLIACGPDPEPVITPDPSPGVSSASPTPPPIPTSTTVLPTLTPEVTWTRIPVLPSVTATPEPLTPSAEREPPPRNEEVDRLGGVAMEILTFLTNDLSPRASGTEEERIAAEYLRDEFAALGYEVSLQPFEVRAISRYERMLSVVEPQTIDIEAVPMWMSAAGVVTGQIVDVGKALPEDIPSEGLEGKIALIERGEVTFDEKVMEVSKTGAIGAIVYNNEPGLFAGTLTEESIPAVAVSQENGHALQNLMADGPVTATISLVYTEESRNVIADKPGTEDGGRVVVLGGHYDTVPSVPGANDNGSGIAALLTIAREIADREYPFTVRFIAFGAEELGLHGSMHYVRQLSDEEITSTAAMLNFDALGSGPTTTTLGTLSLQRMVKTYAEEQGVDVKMRFSLDQGSSDHDPFHEAGIPHIFFLGEDFSRIHTPEDKLQFVRPELLGGAAFLGIALLDMIEEEE